MTVHTKVGGAWKEVANGNMFIKQGGDWENVVAGYTKVGGVWKQFHTGSNPVKYTFLANRSRSFRHNETPWSSTPTVNAVRNGVFSGSTNCPYVGVFGFDSITAGGLTLAEALAERPYITNAAPTAGGSAENYIELRRMTSADSATGLGNAYGNWYIATYTGDTTDATPSADKVSFSTTAVKTYTSGDPLSRGETVKWDLNGSGANRTKMQTFVDHADTNPLVLTNDTSVTALKTAIGSGSADTEYAVFYGSGETTPPKLVITLDYVSAQGN